MRKWGADGPRAYWSSRHPVKPGRGRRARMPRPGVTPRRHGTRRAMLGLSPKRRHLAPVSITEDLIMLKWAIICAIIAVIAGALGFFGVAGAAAGIAKFLFFAFLVIFAIMLVAGLAAGRKVRNTLKR